MNNAKINTMVLLVTCLDFVFLIISSYTTPLECSVPPKYVLYVLFNSFLKIKRSKVS